MIEDLSETKIDRRQLKTLLRAAWKTDLRGSGNPMNPSRSGSIPPIVGVMIMQLFIGIGLAVLAFFIKNPFTASFCVIVTMVVFLAMTVMLEFSNLILSPDEYGIIAVQPVSSKTFFAAKMIHLLAYVNVLGFLLYFPSVVSTTIANLNPLLFPAFLIAGILAASAIGLAFVLLNTLMLKIVNREVMQRVLGYANLAFTLIVYVGFFILPRMLGKESLLLVREFKSDWIYLAPPAWFAALVGLASGDAVLKNLAAFLLALILLAVAYRAGMSKLSLEYAQTLADTVGDKETQVKIRRSRFLSGLLRVVAHREDRAVWTLILSQFKYDNRFRMSILGIIPLTAIYVFMGIANGQSVPDPFAISMSAGKGQMNFLLYIAAALFPYMVALGTVNSGSYRSAWIFYISPADRTRIILSSARFALVWFCFPFTVCLAGIFAWYFGNALHAVLHCLLVYIILMIQSKILVLLYPRIPFSQPPRAGQRSLSVLVMVFISLPLMCVPMVIISLVGYGGYTGYAIWVAAALATNFVFHWIIKKTIPGRVANMEFTAPV